MIIISWWKIKIYWWNIVKKFLIKLIEIGMIIDLNNLFSNHSYMSFSLSLIFLDFCLSTIQKEAD